MREIAILKHLLEHRDREHNIRSIAKGIGMDYKNTYLLIKKLEKKSLLHLESFGRAQKVTLHHKFSPLLFQAEYERRESFLRNRDLKLIYQHLQQVPVPYIALLFGSHAKGTAGRHSDIDLLAFGIDEQIIREALSILPHHIHLTVISPDEFVHMARSREFTIVSEAMLHNIILIGIEDYYRLLEHAERTTNKRG